MITIHARNIPDAYVECLWKMRIYGEQEQSRNGPVMTIPDPVLLQVDNPRERVIFDPVRDANPFFHVMEFVWMIAGSNDVKWIEQFNKRFRNFADVGTDTIHGAYGHRWIHHFGRNQIQLVADLLRADPTTRRAVMGMWDPRSDLTPHADLPCNTQIMFRVIEGKLDMTVINRSNDLIWGMLGANAVHMTYLHELVWCMRRYTPGGDTTRGIIFTNNLHIYKNLDKFEQIYNTVEIVVPDAPHEPYELLTETETYEALVADCVKLMNLEDDHTFETDWMSYVAYPMYMAYTQRHEVRYFTAMIEASDWRIACEEWINRRKGK